MNRGVQRFIPIIFLIVIIGLIIAAAVSVVRIFTTDDNSNQTSQVTDTSTEALLNTSADRSVQMTVRGQIVGDEVFRSYQVVVTPSQREFTRYKGYLDQPLVSKTYANNTKAYDEFVHALARANMTQGEAFTGEADDTRGICANGVLYEFEVMKGQEMLKRLWSTSCGDIKGSLTANSAALQQLFLAQVPDATQYIGKD